MREIAGTNGPKASDAGRRFYRPELDGLRFYAFLGVFLCHILPLDGEFYQSLHFPVPWLWAAAAKAGASGVDLFFALSAFLITSLLLRERQETGSISVRHFYIRRALRIWPLYFVVVMLGAFLALTTKDESQYWYYDQRLPWYYVAGYLAFVANWVYAIFGTTRSICAPLWTISIEEQFYFVWPAVMVTLKRRGILIAAIFTFLFATLSQVALALKGVSGSYIYFGTASRCDSLAIGVFLALGTSRPPQLTAFVRLFFIGSGVLAWVAASAWLRNELGPANISMVLGRLVISLASGSILYGSLHSRHRILTCGVVVRMGKISYGLYVLHFTGLLIVLSLFKPSYGWRLLATKGLGLVITVLLAYASYRWIESPFLRLKDRFATVPSRPV